MVTALVSHCCRAPIEHDGWGHVLCSNCWRAAVPTPLRRDLITWLFPSEAQPRPDSEPVLVRYGRKLEALRPGAVRGHPDGWFWIDA